MARNMTFALRKRMIKNDYAKLFSKMKCKLVMLKMRSLRNVVYTKREI